MYDNRAVLEPVLSHKNGVVGDHGGSTRHRDKWMQHPGRSQGSFFETISGLILGQIFPGLLRAAPSVRRTEQGQGSQTEG